MKKRLATFLSLIITFIIIYPFVSYSITSTIVLDLDYARARIEKYDYQGEKLKTLLIELEEKMEVLSSSDGWKKVRFVANHYTPPPLWKYIHQHIDDYPQEIFKRLKINPEDISMISTGADMGNLAIVKETEEDFIAYCLATAGVRSNAQRMGVDKGLFVEKLSETGTINIIILTNRTLSPGAMVRAVITATEAKSAALQDLDIRSSYTPLQNPATGTGTDSIIVVSGKGPLIKCTGGHCKMGELIARAVKKAVSIAIERQNGLVPSRNLENRLMERGIETSRLVKAALTLYPKFIQEKTPELEERLEKELKRELQYVNLVSMIIAALYLEDAASRGLIPGLPVEIYQEKAPHLRVGSILGRQIAQSIGGKAALPLFAELAVQFPKPLKGLPPIITNLCQGITAGIIAEVNKQLGLLEVELLINFEPIKKPGIKKFLILKQGTTVARALDSVVQVKWAQKEPHHLLAMEIEGVKSNQANDLWWLYNVNGLHPFNIPADEYIVKEGDHIQWFLSKSGQYLPTK
jgi:adenosylcobinamide amidohydrolase